MCIIIAFQTKGFCSPLIRLCGNMKVQPFTNYLYSVVVSLPRFKPHNGSGSVPQRSGAVPSTRRA